MPVRSMYLKLSSAAVICTLATLNCTSPSGNISKQTMTHIGHQLFFDTRLSINNSKSCAGCHNPDLYFTDGYKQTIGTYADVQLRNTPSIINSVDLPFLNLANKKVTSFASQMQVPLFSKQHFEMGMQANNNNIIKIIFSDSSYKKYKVPHNLRTWSFVIDCLSEYQRQIISRNAPFDQYIKDSTNYILAPSAKVGFNLFTNVYRCNQCHAGKDFGATPNLYFANNKLYTQQQYASKQDKGLYNESKNTNDIGIFRIPSLRNVAMTAPYMHDGSLPTLSAVLDHYSKTHVNINEQHKKYIIAFLESLTDTSILNQWYCKDPNAQ